MLQTDRLIILPLTYEQLQKYTLNDFSLEAELKVLPSSRSISAALKEALEETIIPNVMDPDKDYRYHTLWTAISKTQQKMVGDLCIQGAPDAAGAIEIGYGTYPEFQNQGYMTECVQAIIEWAKMQPAIKTILASTDPSNSASFKVLEKNGFLKTGEADGLFHWALSVL